MNSQQPNLRDRLYNLFTNYRNFMNFSNEAVANHPPGTSQGDSVESVHDVIHTTVGGVDQYGNMAYLEYSSFDPIFWFHHR